MPLALKKRADWGSRAPVLKIQVIGSVACRKIDRRAERARSSK
jgi:hypothetical protein